MNKVYDILYELTGSTPDSNMAVKLAEGRLLKLIKLERKRAVIEELDAILNDGFIGVDCGDFEYIQDRLAEQTNE